jgi:hypothetical protein
MRRLLVIALCLSALCAAPARAQAGATPAKVAMVSLIGDVLTVDTYRRRVGTGVDANRQEFFPVATPEFDDAALLSAQQTLATLLPGATIDALSQPAAGTDADPERLLADGRPDAGNTLVANLRQHGYTHLLVIAKHRAPARMQLANVAIGSGQVKGLGFYIDNNVAIRNAETNKRSRGFVAPYVSVRLALIDLAALDLQAERAIMASTSHSNPDGFDPWGGMSASEKVGALNDLIREHVPRALREMVAPR